MDIINQDNNRIVLTDTKPSDMETLYKYYDAVRTGDPDRQVNDGVDIEALEFAIQRIAELEQRITELAQQVRIRGERMERMFRNLPLKLQVYLKDMGEFDDNGKVL